MAYVRRKRIKGHDYYYLVQSYRQNGKVRSRTLKYLGKTPEVPAQYLYLLESPRDSVQQTRLWDEAKSRS